MTPINRSVGITGMGMAMTATWVGSMRMAMSMTVVRGINMGVTVSSAGM